MPELIPGATIRIGDCLEVRRGMADNTVDAIVTDSPHGLSLTGLTGAHADTFGIDSPGRQKERR